MHEKELNREELRPALILMASGFGERFGGNKLLEEVGGEKLYMRAAKLYAGIESIEKLIVVSRYEEILKNLEKMGYTAVRNDFAHMGISASIRLGTIAAAGCNAYIFAVADQPFLERDTVKGLIEGYRNSGKGLGCVSFKERLGNPAIFSEYYREELMALCKDTGGKAVIKKNMKDLYLFEAYSELELADIDTVEDKEKLSWRRKRI